MRGLRWLRLRLWRRWRGLSLRGRILLPAIGLMLAAGATAALGFAGGTARAQRELVSAQAGLDAAMVQYALTSRAEAVSAALHALAGDTALQPGAADGDATALAEQVRGDLRLDVLAAFDAAGAEYLRSVTPGAAYSGALPRADAPDEPYVAVDGDRLLLLSQARLPGGGTLVAGVDLERELLRTVGEAGQSAAASLSLDRVQVAIAPSVGSRPEAYAWQGTIRVAGTPLQLRLSPRPPSALHALTMGTATVAVMVASVLALLHVLGFVLRGTLTRPVRDLAAAVGEVSRGDLSRRVPVPDASSAWQLEEVGALSAAYNTMVDRLQTHYDELDAKVADRTRQLVTATEVARAASASLALDEVLPAATHLICERFGLASAAVYLKDADKEAARLRQAAYGAPHLACLTESVAPTDGSPAGRALASRRQQVSATSTELPGVEEAALPLLAGEVVVGLLVVRSAGRRFTGGDLSALTIMADQLALAAHNSRLHLALVRYTEQLRASNQELEAFAHTVAHDLKSPVYVMTTLAELLAEESGEATREQIGDWAGRLLATGYKMDSIIKELLLLAAVRRDTRPNIAPLDMEAIVGQARLRVSHLVRDRGAEISLGGSWPTALGYGPWVEEVWVNYLSNAVKYGGEPPRVWLGADEPRDGFVRFWVRDNGPGLPEGAQERLFLEFSQLPQHAPRAQGHGLGLSIVRRIVERLGGDVGLTSAPGEGSTFSFSLPVAASTAPKPAGTTAS